MVEKFVNWSNNEEPTVEQSNIPWQDFQGLSWLFYEDCSIETKDSGMKSLISYA